MNDLEAIVLPLHDKPLPDRRRALDALVALGSATLTMPNACGASHWSADHEWVYAFGGVIGRGGTQEEAVAEWFKAAERQIGARRATPPTGAIRNRLDSFLRNLVTEVPFIALQSGRSRTAVSAAVLRMMAEELATVDAGDALGLMETVGEIISPVEMRSAPDDALAAEFAATVARIEAKVLKEGAAA